MICDFTFGTEKPNEASFPHAYTSFMIRGTAWKEQWLLGISISISISLHLERVSSGCWALGRRARTMCKGRKRQGRHTGEVLSSLSSSSLMFLVLSSSSTSNIEIVIIYWFFPQRPPEADIVPCPPFGQPWSSFLFFHIIVISWSISIWSFSQTWLAPCWLCLPLGSMWAPLCSQLHRRRILSAANQHLSMTGGPIIISSVRSSLRNHVPPQIGKHLLNFHSAHATVLQ